MHTDGALYAIVGVASLTRGSVGVLVDMKSVLVLLCIDAECGSVETAGQLAFTNTMHGGKDWACRKSKMVSERRLWQPVVLP